MSKKTLPKAAAEYKVAGSSPLVAREVRAGSNQLAEFDCTVTYVDSLAASMHETVEDLLDLGLVDKTTMRRFDESCLTAVPDLDGEQIKALRAREEVSQAVLARYLGVSLNAVGQWERGERKATGAAAKLLALVERHGLGYIR
jgi:putative transcriptional regulator